MTTAGQVPPGPQVDALADWVRAHLPAGETFSSDELSREYSPAEQFRSEASGLLSVLLPGDDPPLLMWFRAEQVQEINGGNPSEALAPDSRPGALNPRRSFDTWKQTVSGRSRPWRTLEIDSVRGFGRRLAPLLQQHRVRELNIQLRRANEQLASLAATDAVTGLANRRAFDERVGYEWARARRRGAPVALLTLDLDLFKQYNDHFGHPAGDACLRQVSQAIAMARRATDLPARVGGEEFSVLFSDTDLQGALVIAEKIRSQIQALQISHPRSPFGVVTASCGLAYRYLPTPRACKAWSVRPTPRCMPRRPLAATAW